MRLFALLLLLLDFVVGFDSSNEGYSMFLLFCCCFCLDGEERDLFKFDFFRLGGEMLCDCDRLSFPLVAPHALPRREAEVEWR